MRTSTGRVAIISIFLAALTAAGVVWALQAARAADERAAAQLQATADAEDSAAFVKALADLTLPTNVARETTEVDGCRSASFSRCWTAKTEPEQTIEALRTSLTNADVVSITERPGVAQEAVAATMSDYMLIVETGNEQRIALSVMPKKLRDQADGKGSTEYRGSVIQGLPTLG